MRLELSRQIFGRFSYMRFNENPSVVPCGRIDGQKDMTRLTVTFRNFANTPKNRRNEKSSVQ
jgi:hypothetical protein